MNIWSIGLIFVPASWAERCFSCCGSGWVSLVMYSGSLALAKMGGWNFYATIAVLGIAATLYTYFGGLEGVVWTDVIQALDAVWRSGGDRALRMA